METQKTNNQELPIPSKKYKLGYILMFGFGLLALTVLVLVNNSEARPSYEPKAPIAQAEYEKAVQSFCEVQLRNLAKAKIEDELNGVGSEPAKMDDWNKKAKLDCATVKALEPVF